MDVCESEQALQKHSVEETPRPPLFPAEKNNGTTRRSRTREVSSRYKSPSLSVSSGPRRCPSPNITRTSTSSLVSVPKRAISAERKRPSTPPSPPSSSTPVRDATTEGQLESRKMIGSRLPEVLWPATMRSLSVSFQSDTFSLPISKREKPVGNALSDRTLKPSSNVTHKRGETTPVCRKPTPERKRSPLKGKNTHDKSENSTPVDGLHARLIDQHRWPSRTSGKISSSALNRSMDLSDKSSKASALPHPGIGISCLRRMSLDGMTKPLQKSASDAERLLSSLSGNARIEFERCSVDDNALRVQNPPTSSNVLERTASVTPSTRSQNFPCPGSRPPSPNKKSVTSSSASRGVSPARARALNPTPSRGPSPSRTRPSSPSRQSNNSTSVLSFIVDIRKGKAAASHIEDVHQLRLLYNRHWQWRYANAQADTALYFQKVTAEKTLCNVWRTTSEQWNSVTKKRIDLQQLRLKLKLYSVLNEQMAYLNEWALTERDHTSSLSRAIQDLQASTIRLPVTGGARAAVSSTVDVMKSIGSSICSILSQVEGMNHLISELADVAAQERAMLDECSAILSSTAAMQVEEYSLGTHLVQLKSAQKSGELTTFSN
ncbi:unnamed protein product [Ilex paraguariensis]|uniref:AUGMIN subunit 8 n=1 Tax=Ilex paraguariensis TaxID=185542 RepID=A0ABC8TPP2_9AQUA